MTSSPPSPEPSPAPSPEPTPAPTSAPLRRRGFLGLAGAAAAVGLLPGTAAAAPAVPAQAPVPPPAGRPTAGLRIRVDAARRAYGSAFPAHPTNGEEESYPFLANYAKGLPHNEFGEPDQAAYRAFRDAITAGSLARLEAVPQGTSPARPQLNPLSALAFESLGDDSHRFVCPPVPRLDSAAGSADAGENYWMALLRDVPFTEYGTHPDVPAACAELSRYTDFRGPRQGGVVTPDTLFRGDTPDDLVGPWVSQLLQRDVTFGTLTFSQRQDTVAPGVDYMTEFGDWLDAQRGAPRPYLPGDRDFANPRYIRTGRDMGHWTHFDQSYQAYLHAALILIGLGAPPAEILDPGNPYATTRRQVGFATWGNPALYALIGEVSNRGLKANLYQQFAVHRRLRPEAHAARYEVHLTRDPGRYDGILHPELFESEALGRTRARWGSYLLPQMFKEGSPTSPEHPSGHAINGAACITVLKAWFNEAYPLPAPVVPNGDGTALVPYTGPGADRLTIGTELNKLYSNVGYGRNFGGAHTRTSIQDSRRIGEDVAISVLRDHLATVVEGGSLSFTRFDGTPVTISAD